MATSITNTSISTDTINVDNGVLYVDNVNNRVEISGKSAISVNNHMDMTGEAILQFGDQSALWQYNSTNTHFSQGIYYNNGYKFVGNYKGTWLSLNEEGFVFRGTTNTPSAGTASGEETVLKVNTVTGAIELKSLTVATLDANAPAGSIAYVTDDNGNLYYKNALAWKSFTAPLGTESNPAPTAKAIVDAGDANGDGIYYLQNSSVNGGAAFPAYCDMTKNGGGWILILAVDGSSLGNMGWTASNIGSRNTSAPSLTPPGGYSIISWADYFHTNDAGWQWMVEATDTYATRYTYGGIFTANSAGYLLYTQNSGQTNISVDEWFNLSGFVENSGVGQRVPWTELPGGSNSGRPVYTTYNGSSSWWGTICQSDSDYASYYSGPWISGTFQSPVYKRVWVR